MRTASARVARNTDRDAVSESRGAASAAGFSATRMRVSEPVQASAVEAVNSASPQSLSRISSSSSLLYTTAANNNAAFLGDVDG